MSYSRNYSRTVTQSYSKTVTVSYPKSDTSGTVTTTVHGTVEVPINVEIYVDTDNFDSKVSGCKRSVTMLNTAVVATTAEEILAKNEASKKIGNSVVSGFFNYISAELSQLKSELASKCNSLLAALFEQKGASENKSLQMESDYERICNRYGKLFADLDNELLTRIKALDAPIFNVNNNLLNCSSPSVDNSLLGVAAILSAETAQIDAILAASTIKSRGKELIGKANVFLSGAYNLQNTLNEMLLDDSDNSDGLYMLPVIYVESIENMSSIKRKVYGQSALLLQKVKGIEVALEERFQSPKIKWNTIPHSYSEKVDLYFSNEMSMSQIDSRVANVIMKLKSNDKINVVKNR